MNTKNYQQLIDLYMKNCGNLYPLRNIYPSRNAHMLETINTNGVGNVKLRLISGPGETPVPIATITVYVTQGIEKDIPIMHLITSLNPISIELPVAYDLGTQIVGPEYDFSTYNIRIDAFGYYSTSIFNIRIFAGTITVFNINMVSILQKETEPGIEERIDIPPHPRDEVNGLSN